MPLVSFTRQRHFTFGPNRSLPDGTRAVAFSGKRDPSSQHRPLPAPTARCPPLAGKRIWMFPGRPRFIQKAEPRFYRLRASEFPGPCHALCGFAGAGRARRSRCATESVKRGELSCHPEPAERGEGPSQLQSPGPFQRESADCSGAVPLRPAADRDDNQREGAPRDLAAACPAIESA